jgi:hypothetical protein
MSLYWIFAFSEREITRGGGLRDRPLPGLRIAEYREPCIENTAHPDHASGFNAAPPKERIMNKLALRLLAGVAVLALIGLPAQAHAAERVRGTITRVTGNELEVKTREGKDVKLNLTESTTINVLSAAKMSDLKQGTFVGVTAVPNGPGGTLRALEVHVFPEAQRGTGEGHYDWDLVPGSTMTNANIDATVDHRKGKELTLSYKGGSQKIIVPDGVPIVAFAPGDRSLLQPGTPVFLIVQPAADGSLTVLRISVGKDGVKPPM